MSESPVFKLEAFKQDIENLKATLDKLEIVYTQQPVPVQIKQDDGSVRGGQTIMIPTFNIQQFLGRLCMIIEDLQQLQTGGQNDMDMVPQCRVHGIDGPFLFIEDSPYCWSCIVDKSVGLTEGECGWLAVEEE